MGSQDTTIWYKRKPQPLSRDQEGFTEILKDVIGDLKTAGYNPTAQLAGYIVSDDPTYITAYNGARTKITLIDRYDILAEILTHYIATKIDNSK